jgi:hypothetical protein
MQVIFFPKTVIHTTLLLLVLGFLSKKFFTAPFTQSWLVPNADIASIACLEWSLGRWTD